MGLGDRGGRGRSSGAQGQTGRLSLAEALLVSPGHSGMAGGDLYGLPNRCRSCDAVAPGSTGSGWDGQLGTPDNGVLASGVLASND